jgi:hypothetical protein
MMVGVAAFSSISLALSFFCSQALSRPSRQPVTQAVGRWLTGNINL